MSNGEKSVLEKCLALLVKIGMMVVDGVRDPAQVLRWLQVIVSREDFVSVLDTPPSAQINTTPADWRQEWQKFYQEVFGLTTDLSDVELKDDPGGFGWAVFVAQGLTLNQAYAKCRDRFPCSSVYGDGLDKAVPQNDRTSVTSYTKRFRNRVEADEENKNLSANDLAKQKIQGNTLLERLLLGLWYHWRTGGGQLDLLNWALCCGSRYRDGGAPCVGWGEGQFQVCRCLPGGASVDVRARSAV